MNVRTLLVAAAALSLSACMFPKAGVAPSPLDSEALARVQGTWPDSTPESLEHGRQLFLTSCDGCHSYPDLAHYTEDRWPTIMQRMGKKADYSETDTALVLRFVLAARQAQP